MLSTSIWSSFARKLTLLCRIKNTLHTKQGKHSTSATFYHTWTTVACSGAMQTHQSAFTNYKAKMCCQNNNRLWIHSPKWSTVETIILAATTRVFEIQTVIICIQSNEWVSSHPPDYAVHCSNRSWTFWAEEPGLMLEGTCNCDAWCNDHFY